MIKHPNMLFDLSPFILFHLVCNNVLNSQFLQKSIPIQSNKIPYIDTLIERENQQKLANMSNNDFVRQDLNQSTIQIIQQNPHDEKIRQMSLRVISKGNQFSKKSLKQVDHSLKDIEKDLAENKQRFLLQNQNQIKSGSSLLSIRNISPDLELKSTRSYQINKEDIQLSQSNKTQQKSPKTKKIALKSKLSQKQRFIPQQQPIEISSNKFFKQNVRRTTEIKQFSPILLQPKNQNENIVTCLPKKEERTPVIGASGINLYQQVLAKNFQVIDNLLRKLNQIYAHQEQYESGIIQINEKLHKLQIDNENIHHQFRTSHFMIDKKLNSVSNEYSNILHDLTLMKKQFTLQNGINVGFVHSVVDKNILEEGEENIVKNNLGNSNNRKQSAFNLQSHKRNQNRSLSINRNTEDENSNNLRFNSQNKNSNWVNMRGLDEKNLGKLLLQQINESSRQSILSSYDSSQSEKNFINNQNQYQDKCSSPLIKSKDNQKNRNQVMKTISKKDKNSNKISIDNFDMTQIQQLKKFISHQLIKKTEQSDELKKFTNMGIQQTINNKIESIEKKWQEKLSEIKIDLSSKLLQKEFKNQILIDVDTKTKNICTESISQFQVSFQAEIKSIYDKMLHDLSNKIQRQQLRINLKQVLDTITHRVNSIMSDCYHKFAERTETKRAILFLEKKINKIVETQKKFNSKSISQQTDATTKCLSCSKSVSTLHNGSPVKFNATQPMFTQVNLNTIKDPDNLEEHLALERQNQTLREENIVTARKSRINMNQKNGELIDSRHKPHNYSQNIGSFYIKKGQPIIKADQIKQNTKVFKRNHPNHPSKELFKKKLKNSESSYNVSPSQSIFGDISSKNWKDKANSLLKKEAIKFRSRSMSKKEK